MSMSPISTPNLPKPVQSEHTAPQNLVSDKVTTTITLTPDQIKQLDQATREIATLFAPAGGLSGELDPPSMSTVRATLEENKALHEKLSSLQVRTEDAEAFCLMFEGLSAAIGKMDAASASAQEEYDYTMEIGRAMFEIVSSDDSTTKKQARIGAALASNPTLGAQVMALSENDLTALILECMKMMMDSNREMQKTFQEMGIAEAQLQMQMLSKAASQTRSAAAKQMIATVIQGATQITGGLGQAYSAGKSFDNTMKGHADGQRANRLENDIKNGRGHDLMPGEVEELQRSAAHSNALGAKQHSYGQAWGQATGGMGTTASAGFTYESQMRQADADLSRKSATAAEISRQTHWAIASEANSGINKGIDLLQSLLSSQVQTSKHLGSRIAG